MLGRTTIASTLALGFAVAAGCGGKEVPATKVSGTVQGVGFKDPHAIYNVGPGFAAERGQALVLISDDPDACSHLTRSHSRSQVSSRDAGSDFIPSLFLSMTEDSALGSNDRRIGDDMSADFDLGSDFRHDLPDLHPSATAGSGRIDRSDTGDKSTDLAEGSFDLSFDGGERLTGIFRASRCDLLFRRSHAACDAGGVPLWSLLDVAAFIGMARRRRPRTI